MSYAPADAYTNLRHLALATSAATLGAQGEVFGVVMDTGYPEAVVTLVAMADGAASLYFSYGGGLIGAGQHERPAVAAQSLVAFAAHNTAHLVPTADESLPDPGHTRFTVLTRNGWLMADAIEDELGNNRHVLSPLFYAAHELIAEMRAVEERLSDT